MNAALDSTSTIDISKRDLTLDIARVFCVLLVVAIHLMMVGVGYDSSGALSISRPLENVGWFGLATWAGQIMPLFFVVGGFAGLTAWRSLQRRGGSAPDYVRTRILRLAQPALPLFVFYVVVIGIARLVGVDPELLDVVVMGAGQPLWFLAAFALCQVFLPTMARLHGTHPRATPAVLLAGAVVVDAARYSTGISAIGLVNLVFVWLLIQQIGFWYADGWFVRRSVWMLLAIAAVCYALLVPLTRFGGYSVDMLTNLNPPTVPLILLGLAQACILRLLRPALSALMRTHAARAVVFIVGSRLMTIYLWHLPLIIALSGIALLIPGASPEPGGSTWWLTRPVFYLLVIVALYGLSALVGRWENPVIGQTAPSTAVIAVAAALTFIPAFCVMQWFLDFPLAILGAVCLSIAVALLRDRSGARPAPSKRPSSAAPAGSAGAVGSAAPQATSGASSSSSRSRHRRQNQ